jgi:mannose-6-phosphate isomerase
VVSAHKNGDCRVRGGQYDGCTLSQLWNEHRELFGGQEGDQFPILIKIIDAKQDLSIQVHPDDAYAKVHENGSLGKTECWYIMDCEPGARIIYGFKNKISTEDFAKAIEENRIDDVVNYVEVKKGDFFLIEAGTLHAICKGILLAEVQQNSNVTFRAYDYNRFDAKCNGPRPLHIKETLDVTKCEPPCPSIPTLTKTEKLDGATKSELVSFELFSVNKVEVTSGYTGTADENSFVHIMVLDGSGTISCGDITLDITKGEGVFIPASAGDYTVNGTLTVLESRV